ncbi:membrane protein EE36 [Proboscivirus elephantidbeta5]|uniref:Membrane protein EE36 n=1 Tax=Elephant endotheliotropic herpesvirus 5 TaxID=768738 RepID=A0A075CZR5_9BETA|nr:membrane protein EE36 [Elephant endotheliotropic herpesvirus 5]AHC02799.1 membrane protein EE36 [Elephant endotheliotropic herpesvirus 5]
MYRHILENGMKILYESENEEIELIFQETQDGMPCDIGDTVRSDYYITLLLILACLLFILWFGMEFRNMVSEVSIADPLLAVFFTASGIARVLYENKRHEALPRHQLMRYFAEFMVSQYCTIFCSFMLTYTVYMYKRNQLSARTRIHFVNLIRLLSRRVMFFITATIYNINMYTFAIMTPFNRSVIILCSYLGLYVLLMLAVSEILDGSVNLFNEFSPESLIVSVAVLVIHYGYTYINYFHTFNVSVITFSVCMYVVSRILLLH